MDWMDDDIFRSDSCSFVIVLSIVEFLDVDIFEGLFLSCAVDGVVFAVALAVVVVVVVVIVVKWQQNWVGLIRVVVVVDVVNIPMHHDLVGGVPRIRVSPFISGCFGKHDVSPCAMNLLRFLYGHLVRPASLLCVCQHQFIHSGVCPC